MGTGCLPPPRGEGGPSKPHSKLKKSSRFPLYRRRSLKGLSNSVEGARAPPTWIRRCSASTWRVARTLLRLTEGGLSTFPSAINLRASGSPGDRAFHEGRESSWRRDFGRTSLSACRIDGESRSSRRQLAAKPRAWRADRISSQERVPPSCSVSCCGVVMTARVGLGRKSNPRPVSILVSIGGGVWT